jgi:hypothetical protein
MFGFAALIKSRLPILLLHSELDACQDLCIETNYHFVVYSAPLLPNILPHIQTLLNFVINTLPKPVLIALLYRLAILHFASGILPTIGADSWESEEGVDDTWSDRPVSFACLGFVVLDYFNLILLPVCRHLR